MVHGRVGIKMSDWRTIDISGKRIKGVGRDYEIPGACREDHMLSRCVFRWFHFFSISILHCRLGQYAMGKSRHATTLNVQRASS